MYNVIFLVCYLLRVTRISLLSVPSSSIKYCLTLKCIKVSLLKNNYKNNYTLICFLLKNWSIYCALLSPFFKNKVKGIAEKPL